MLPSKGYFSPLPCPFYESGECLRPHCHYRHSKKDKAPDSSEASVTKPSTKETSKLEVSRIQELVNSVKAISKANSTLQNDKIDNSKPIANSAESISQLQNNKKDTEIPSYKPTPIAELNKRHIPVVYAPTRPTGLVRRKEPKDSMVYNPKSITKLSNAYIPSSTGNTDSTLTYQPTKITTSFSVDDCRTLLNDKKTVSDEDKSMVLDRLVDEEFCDETPEINPNSNKNEKIEISEQIKNKEIVNDTNETNLSNQQHSDSKKDETSLNSHKTSDKHKSSSSKDKKESSKDHSKQHSSKSSSEHRSKSKSESSKSSTKSNNDSSKKSSSKDGHSRSKSSSSSSKKSDESKSKHSSSKHDSKSSSMSKSSRSSSEKNESQSKSKRDGSPSRSRSSENKSKRRSSGSSEKTEKHKSSSDNNDKKSESRSSSSNKKCRKKDRGEKRSSRGDREISPPPAKMAKLNATSDEGSGEDMSNGDDYESCDSDVEEIVCKEEPIVIDSSSNSSTDHLPCNDDQWSGVDSSQDSPPPSPPPEKIARLELTEKAQVTPSTLQSILCERWRRARETVLTKSAVPGKIKIFQVPNVKKLLTAKDELLKAKETVRKPAPSPATHSASREADHFEEYIPTPIVRVARAPKESIARYPAVKIEDTLRVPHSIRQSCLNNIYDEYTKYVSPEKATELAVQKELEICRRTKVAKTYQNACAMAVFKIRKTKGKEEGDADINQESRKETLFSHSVPEFTHGWTMYKCFKPYLLSEDDMVSNGFPIPLESYKGCGYIDKAARRFYTKQPDDECMRICVHCSKNYVVDPKTGFPLEENDCFYHWGRIRRIRGRGGVNETYICCGGEVGSEPCSSGRYHVCNLYDEDCLEGFVRTPPLRPDLSEDQAGIFGIDCEMCYTTQGIDLTRVTVVNLDGEIVYDKIVLPDHPILDYCTRFSGMTEAIIKTADKKLKDVQRDLLKFMNEKTILVGHSLENDLKALRIFHKSVVDTSVVFPHKLGLPFKKSLKHVAKEVLNINIQEKESGHDSKEDANTSMQLMLWKIREDAKGRKPRVIISLDSSRTPQAGR